MFLKKCLLINWGNIPQSEFEFGPINLFSGGNGSGKTTAADAIQTLMTAAHDALFTFNPGQDETTQRGRGGKQVRTLASYVLGCDDGSYARPHATDGYIGGVFHPTEGESGEPFTALQGFRAHLDQSASHAQARLDNTLFIILPGVQLNLSQLIQQRDGEKHVVPLDKVVEHLQRALGQRSVEVYDKKKSYLRRLYGALRGRPDPVPEREAMHAARTFSQFMAYKPVKSISDFVAKEVLEKRDLGEAIRTISEQMKTIHALEREAHHLIETTESLSQAERQCQTYIGTRIELQLSSYANARQQYEAQRQRIESAEHEQAKCGENIKTLQQRAELAQQRRHQTHQKMVALEAQRQGVSALQDKDRLQTRVQELQSQLQQNAAPLLAADQQLEDNLGAIRILQSALDDKRVDLGLAPAPLQTLKAQIKSLLALPYGSRPNLNDLMAQDWIDIAHLEAHLDNALEFEHSHNQLAQALTQPAGDKGGLLEQIQRRSSALDQQLAVQGKQLQQLEQEIQQLSNLHVSYPPHVLQALEAIREQCPQASPKVLCDYVEVTDPEWQMAIEGYLGGARFSLLVELEHEATAIEIVRNLPNRKNKARVIQGKQAQKDAQRLDAQAGSIVDVMTFDHKVAEYYLCASYGNVQRVEDTDTLRHTRRGLTSRGIASGNYSLWRCDLPDSELVFGQGARARALEAKQAQHSQRLDELQQIADLAKQLRALAKACAGISRIAYASIMQEMLAQHRGLQLAENALKELNLGDFHALEADLQQLQDSYRELEQQERALTEEVGGQRSRQQSIVDDIEQLKVSFEQLDLLQSNAAASVHDLARLRVGFSAENALEDVHQALLNGERYKNPPQDIEKCKEQLHVALRQLDKTLLQHNVRSAPANQIEFDASLHQDHDLKAFEAIITLQRELDTLYNRLKNNLLLEKHQTLGELKDTFNSVFVTDLCHAIYQSINDGKRILEDLNRELEHHRFGADRERFYFAYDWLPEFREYWRFFKEIIELPNLGESNTLFDAQLSKSGSKIRDKLISMLLDSDEQKAVRELERVSDYRNYRQYEIYKEPEGKAALPLSQYGTGSGGQLETPAYIIRSAAVTSAFRFNEGKSHLRMVLVDEAFSKMDETRSREVINYLTKTLGLQLLFIMPTSKSGPFLELISNQFVFSKGPSSVPIGQLNSRVLVDRQRCNTENIQVLWAQHRRTIRDQGELDFMAEFNA